MKNLETFNNDLKKGILSESAFNNLLSKNEKSLFDNEKDNDKKNSTICKEKISIIIPTYNRIEQLNECIKSIIRQTYSNFEILIIDDSSNNDTEKKYKHSKDNRIRYFKNEKNLGMGLNRQKGYNLCTGNYVLFIDDDDYFIDNNYFQDTINIFQNDNINIICSNTYIHYEKENIYLLNKLNIPNMIDSLKYLEKFQFEYKKPTSSFPAIFRKQILDKAKFNEMKMMNDTSIYLRAMMMGGKTYFNNKIIGIYRVHGKNDTFNVKADFTIENLEEKKYIYEYVTANKLIKNSQKWFLKEIEITTYHFLSGNIYDRNEVKKVLNWVKENGTISLYVLLNIVFYRNQFVKKITNK